MKHLRHALILGLVALWGALASSCASGVRPSVPPPTYEEVSHPVYLAQSAAADCRPGESTIVCCIKKFPLTAVESCGATAAEAADVLNGIKVLNEASQSAGDETGTQEDDFANNAHLPEWKQRCIRNYVDCTNERWVGSCYQCLRYCEGQQEWPFNQCRKPRKASP